MGQPADTPPSAVAPGTGAALLEAEAARQAERQAERQAPRPESGGRWAYLPHVVLGLLAGAVFSWRFWAPSPWWDEGVTRHVVGLSWGDFVDLITHVDLVHATYYALSRLGLAAVPGDLGSVATLDLLRFVSVLCCAVTATVLYATGRALGTPRAGVLAALAFTASPLVSRYAQEARPYALVTLLSALTTYVLVRALQEGSRRQWQAYAGLLVAGCLVNEISLLVVLAHAVFVAATPGRRLARAWAAATGVAGLVLLPFLAATSLQRGQVSWLTVPTAATLERFLRLQWESFRLPLAVLAVGLLVPVLAVRFHRVRDLPGLRYVVDVAPPTALRQAAVLGLAWGLVPLLSLWLVSQVHPLFVPRYLIFTVPGSALALGAALANLRTGVAGLSVVALVASGWNAQGIYRADSTGHSEDLRSAARVIAAQAKEGDAVLFLPSSRRIVAYAYPEDFAEVDDIAAVAGTGADLLYGKETSSVQDFLDQARTYTRIWVVGGVERQGEQYTDVDEAKMNLLASQRFVVTTVEDSGRFATLLYVKVPRSSTTGRTTDDGTGLSAR